MSDPWGDAFGRPLIHPLCRENMNCKHCSGPIEGRRSHAEYCSEKCANRYRNRTYYKNNPEKLTNSRALQNVNAPKRILTRVKSRAKRDKIPFNLEISDIVIPDVCPVLGIPIVQNQGRRGYHPDSASLDKIIPSKGYVKGNVRVISARANLLKNDATLDEMRLILADLEALDCAGIRL